ncbi:hypothetical protein BACCAP_02278 [Pseudoflavonifractor capillosus ATCC 29799]|uniref:Uncharacterized protein n=1 Tax=Pseudoflavonifractor capillosus ATCC 29799 TaxID=411467 RepID=A6NVN5_9FIRM|nr:hypothetical protein BACCAP_02278 [Pseudoflavonifractor capillosus ATCC 29799]
MLNRRFTIFHDALGEIFALPVLPVKSRRQDSDIA